jgi:hypothetical protein
MTVLAGWQRLEAICIDKVPLRDVGLSELPNQNLYPAEDGCIFEGNTNLTESSRVSSAKALECLNDRQSRDIDPIIGKPGKNSLDRVSSQASEFPVINAERESASEHSKA